MFKRTLDAPSLWRHEGQLLRPSSSPAGHQQHAPDRDEIIRKVPQIVYVVIGEEEYRKIHGFVTVTPEGGKSNGWPHLKTWNSNRYLLLRFRIEVSIYTEESLRKPPRILLSVYFGEVQDHI
jgi:hypothetical protein